MDKNFNHFFISENLQVWVDHTNNITSVKLFAGWPLEHFTMLILLAEYVGITTLSIITLRIASLSISQRT